MKKLFTLLLAIFAMVGMVNATEIWTGSCTIGQWSGSSVTIDKEAFSSAATGNIVKVTFSAYTEKDGSNDVTYWQYSLGQKDNGWISLTNFSGGDLTKGQKSASYILTETNVTELKNYGLAVNGRYITVSKVELLSTTSEPLWTGSISTGNWGNESGMILALSYESKGDLANAQKNDYICVTYTITASDAQVAIQNPNGWSSFGGKDDNSYAAGGTNTGKTYVYTIDDATTLEIIQLNGILVRGKYITITKVELIKPDNRYDAVSVIIGSDGIATWSSSKKLNFNGTGITPYYASAVATEIVTLSPITESGKENTTWGSQGYIIRGSAGTYEVPVITDDNATYYPSTNYLKSTGDYERDIEASTTGIYHYIFAKEKNGGGETIGFYKLESGTHKLAAHKAYLETSTDMTKSMTRGIILDFGDGTTAILNVIDDGDARQISKNDGKYYTLQGTSMQAPTRKGLYILNGKKVLVK